MERDNSTTAERKQENPASQPASPVQETDIEHQLRVNDPSIAAYPHRDSRYRDLGPYRLLRADPTPTSGEGLQHQYHNRSIWMLNTPETLEQLQQQGEWSANPLHPRDNTSRRLSPPVIGAIDPELLDPVLRGTQTQPTASQHAGRGSQSSQQRIPSYTGQLPSAYLEAANTAQIPRAQTTRIDTASQAVVTGGNTIQQISAPSSAPVISGDSSTPPVPSGSGPIRHQPRNGQAVSRSPHARPQSQSSTIDQSGIPGSRAGRSIDYGNRHSDRLRSSLSRVSTASVQRQDNPQVTQAPQGRSQARSPSSAQSHQAPSPFTISNGRRQSMFMGQNPLHGNRQGSVSRGASVAQQAAHNQTSDHGYHTGTQQSTSFSRGPAQDRRTTLPHRDAPVPSSNYSSRQDFTGHQAYSSSQQAYPQSYASLNQGYQFQGQGRPSQHNQGYHSTHDNYGQPYPQYYPQYPTQPTAGIQDYAAGYPPQPSNLPTPIPSGSASPQMLSFGLGSYGNPGSSYGMQPASFGPGYGAANTGTMASYDAYGDPIPSYAQQQAYGTFYNAPIAPAGQGSNMLAAGSGQIGIAPARQSINAASTHGAGITTQHGGNTALPIPELVARPDINDSKAVINARANLAKFNLDKLAANSITGRSGNKPKEDDPRVRVIPPEAFGPPHPRGQYPKEITDVLQFPGQACVAPGCKKHKRDHWPITGFGDLECCALKCEICGEDFTATSSVRRHLRAKHRFCSDDTESKKIYIDVLMANGIPFEEVEHEKKVKGAPVRTKVVDYANLKRKERTPEADNDETSVKTRKTSKKSKTTK